MNRVRRILATVVIAVGILVAGASPASAHSVSGTGGSNFKTTLPRVSPPIAGLHVKVIESGNRMEVTYTGAQTVYVSGLADDQFLRNDTRGVFENLNSTATYIFKTRNGVDPPDNIDPRDPPVWRKVSGGRTARWHDHRVHWMGRTNPPQVRRAPGDPHVIVPDWQFSIRQGATTAVVHGSLEWVPGPNPVPWFALAFLLLVGMVLLARTAAPFIPVALAAAILIVVDVAHAYAIGFANAGGVGTRLGQTFAASIVSIPGWAVGAAGIWLLLRKKVDGFFAVVFTGLIVAVVGGIADLNNLSKSQIAFALPSALARPIVATSLGLGFGLAAAGALAIRRLDPPKPPADPA
jgi:hypothetical protein